MRVEFTVPDGIGQDLMARIVAVTEKISRHPEFAAEIPLDEDDDIQRMFTPERLADIAQADEEIDAGESFTSEQVRDHFAQRQAAWNQAQTA